MAVRTLSMRVSGREPEYGTFIDGARVSVADHRLHIGRYRFARQFALGKACLDIGCGTGYGTAFLASNGVRTMVAGDKSGRAVSEAHHFHNSAGASGFNIFDATALPFADCSFGLVTAFEVIEHVPDYEQVVRQAYRVLRPGGTLIISTPNRYAGPLFFKTSWDNHVHEFVPQELVSLVKKYFGECELYGQDFNDLRQLSIRRLRQTAGRILETLKMRRLETWLGRLLFSHNRLVVFHNDDFYSTETDRGGDVMPVESRRIPTTLVIVARKI